MCDVCVLCSLFSVAPTKACAALPRHRAPSRVCGRTRELSNPQSVVCTPLAKLIWIRLVVRANCCGVAVQVFRGVCHGVVYC